LDSYFNDVLELDELFNLFKCGKGLKDYESQAKAKEEAKVKENNDIESIKVTEHLMDTMKERIHDKIDDVFEVSNKDFYENEINLYPLNDDFIKAVDKQFFEFSYLETDIKYNN